MHAFTGNNNSTTTIEIFIIITRVNNMEIIIRIHFIIIYCVYKYIVYTTVILYDVYWTRKLHSVCPYFSKCLFFVHVRFLIIYLSVSLYSFLYVRCPGNFIQTNAVIIISKIFVIYVIILRDTRYNLSRIFSTEKRRL